MNVGEQISCSSETFLLFESDADETSPVVRHYFHKLMDDIKELENRVFTLKVAGKQMKVEFKLGELPNDLKFLCFLAGELTNSAHNLTTFAKVSKDDYRSLDMKFVPYTYEERCRVVALVAKKK